MNTDFVVGDVVQVTSGHDKNRMHLVVSIDNNGYLAIIDGRYRGVEKPKIKNPRHLIRVANDLTIIEKIKSGQTTNAEIHKLIKAYQKN